MSLTDFPPHSITRYASSNAADSAGGHATTYTAGQSGIPCSIDTDRARIAELFGQQQAQEITHTIGIVARVLTTPFARGDKAVADDNSANYHVEGISTGREYGGVEKFVYLGVSEIL
jgi:hypothetical protein